MLRSCFDLCRKSCYGHLRCSPMGCQPDGCRLFYQTLMPQAYNLQYHMDLRSVKDSKKMRIWHPIGITCKHLKEIETAS